jgi:Helix-turn-helix domain
MPQDGLSLTLDPGALDALADSLAERVAARLATKLDGDRDDRWLGAKDAATYLGLPSVHAVHKLTGARLIPFSQERPGASCYFRRSDLDAYRQRFMKGPAL